MKQFRNTTLAVCTLFFLFSFAQTQSETPNYIGIYGISEGSPGMVTLTIKKNGTYIYKDESSKNRLINTKGTWNKKGSTILLTDEDQLNFHTKWKFSPDGSVAKSSKGLSFYRLIKIGTCN